MDETKVTYDELIGRLRNIRPVLNEPEKLSENILTKIECISAYKKKNKVIHIIGSVSGAAAVLLLCLLTYDTIHLSATHPKEMSSQTETPAQKIFFKMKNKNTAEEVKDYSASKKIAYFSSIIKEKQERKEKKAHFHTTLSAQSK